MFFRRIFLRGMFNVFQKNLSEKNAFFQRRILLLLLRTEQNDVVPGS
jgi:hypothetical protein